MAAVSVKRSINLNGHAFQDCIIYSLKRAFAKFCYYFPGRRENLLHCEFLYSDWLTYSLCISS